ncbi:MAG: ABC transporter permease, partial [Spirochaetes bacterium]|nr:ABC transporter permease [Spirochaetota bacterium]
MDDIHTQSYSRRNAARYIISISEMPILILFVILFLVLTLLLPNFFTKANLHALFLSISLNSIVAIGMTLVLVSGGIDLSVGSVSGLAGGLTGLLLINSVPIWAAVFLGLFLSILIGLFNGLTIVKLKVNPLITTLGIMYVSRGVLFIFTAGRGIPNLPQNFQAIAQKTVYGIQTPILIMLVFLILSDLFLRRSTFFRHYYYIGQNTKTARLAGIKTLQMRISSYIASALLSGVSGILLASRAGGAMALAGQGLEFKVITACIIGGCSLEGGRGTVLGSFLGMLVMGITL